MRGPLLEFQGLRLLDQCQGSFVLFGAWSSFILCKKDSFFFPGQCGLRLGFRSLGALSRFASPNVHNLALLGILDKNITFCVGSNSWFLAIVLPQDLLAFESESLVIKCAEKSFRNFHGPTTRAVATVILDCAMALGRRCALLTEVLSLFWSLAAVCLLSQRLHVALWYILEP